MWQFAVQEIPRIARRLSHPTNPKVWRTETHGNLGIFEILGPHRVEIRRLLRTHGVRRLRVYGSVARGDADYRSDVDLLVDWLTPGKWNGVERLAGDLEELLKRPVQVHAEKDTYWAIRDRILSEATEFL